MSNSYDDAKYGVIQRKWFGLPKTRGGDVASGYSIAGSAATSTKHLRFWYPKGPIKLLKAGAMNLATVNIASTAADVIPVRVYADGASGSTGISFNWAMTSTKVAPHTIASSSTVTRQKVKAGAYVKITTGTPQTGKGTRITGSVVTGELAFFVDYTPAFDSGWAN